MEISGKKILVTGGAGFIGCHTVDLLLQRGYGVRILDSLAPPVHEAGRLPEYVPLDDVEFIQADFREEEAIRRFLTRFPQAVQGPLLRRRLSALQRR